MNTPYRQRQIEKRVLQTLLAMGFDYVNSAERYFKIYGLVFRVQLVALDKASGTWYLRLRQQDGQQIGGFPMETLFSTEHRTEIEIVKYIMQWVYDTAYTIGKNNYKKSINKALEKIIGE